MMPSPQRGARQLVRHVAFGDSELAVPSSHCSCAYESRRPSPHPGSFKQSLRQRLQSGPQLHIGSPGSQTSPGSSVPLPHNEPTHTPLMHVPTSRPNEHAVVSASPSHAVTCTGDAQPPPSTHCLSAGHTIPPPQSFECLSTHAIFAHNATHAIIATRTSNLLYIGGSIATQHLRELHRSP